MSKVHKDDEVPIILQALSVVIAVHKLVNIWDLPEGLKGYFDFISRNAAHLNRERLEVEAMPEETENQQKIKAAAVRRNVWSQTRHGAFWSIENITNVAIELVWSAHVVARNVNRLRKVMGMKAIDFYQEALEYDRMVEDDPKTEVYSQGGGVRDPGAEASD